MQIATQPRYPMVRSMAAPVAQAAPAQAKPTQAAPAAPTASAQAAEAGQAFAQQFGAFTQKAQSFLSNLWDTVLGPALNSLIGMIKGAFGG
jgi:cell division septation protein DedD